MPLIIIACALLVFALIAGLAHAIRLYRPVDLPPSRNVGRRLLPVLGQAHGWARKGCGQCYFFEPTGFSEVQRRAPAAAEAAKWLSPSQMAIVEKKTHPDGWTEEAGFEAAEGQPVAMGGPRWDEIGVCHKRPGTMTFPQSQCEEWR